jgi:hypothetical protein
MKRQYDIIQNGYRKWKQAIRSTKIKRVGRGSGGEYRGGGSQEHDFLHDDPNIIEIEEEINWSDIIGAIREETQLLEMGPDPNEGNERGDVLQISNGEIPREQQVIPRWSSSSSSDSKVEHVQTREITRPGDDVLSVLDVNSNGRLPHKEGPFEDSLEYSFITNSPKNGNREGFTDENFPPSRFVTERAAHGVKLRTTDRRVRSVGSYPPHPVPSLGEMWDDDDRQRRRTNEGWESPERSNGTLSATIDLQITTEQMKSIAMKYNAL